MTRWHLIVVSAILVAFPIAAIGAESGKPSRLYRLAGFDMTFDNTGRVSVPVPIGARTVHLLVDTGGDTSTLTQSTVASLGLDQYYSNGVQEKVYGGEILNRFVVVREATFGKIDGQELPFYVMPDEKLPPGEDGLLSPDIMSKFDVDFDFASAKFNIFSQDHCEGKINYWTNQLPTKVDIDSSEERHLLVRVLLDGKVITAELDTGASYSVASLDDINDDFGLHDNDPDLKLLSGSRDGEHVYRYPFKVLSFGGVAVYQPNLHLIPDSESHMPHTFLIGMDILRQLHIYVAYGEQALYITSATAH
jgi:predicted aspartyl protease